MAWGNGSLEFWKTGLNEIESIDSKFRKILEIEYL
jgi:hypothetical protein